MSSFKLRTSTVRFPPDPADIKRPQRMLRISSSVMQWSPSSRSVLRSSSAMRLRMGVPTRTSIRTISMTFFPWVARVFFCFLSSWLVRPCLATSCCNLSLQVNSCHYLWLYTTALLHLLLSLDRILQVDHFGHELGVIRMLLEIRSRDPRDLPNAASSNLLEEA